MHLLATNRFCLFSDPSPALRAPVGGSYKPRWKKKYGWLKYDRARQRVTCAVCAEAEQRGLLAAMAKRDDAFTSRGYNGWRNAIIKFTKHENSNCHCEATKRLSEVEAQNSTAAKMLLTGKAKQQHENRVALRHIFNAIVLLSAQGLPMRRRDEELSNLRQTLRMTAWESPELTKWLERRQHGQQTFLSPDIQYQIQRQLAHTVLRQLTAEVAGAQFFSVMVDETTDNTQREQLSICVRYVTDNLTAEELFVGLYHAESTTGEVLARLIQDALQRLQLPITGLRGQCYDGASNMSGEFRGK